MIIIFHIFSGIACLKKTSNIVIWTLFALLRDNLGGNDGKTMWVKIMDWRGIVENCDEYHEKSCG